DTAGCFYESTAEMPFRDFQRESRRRAIIHRRTACIDHPKVELVPVVIRDRSVSEAADYEWPFELAVTAAPVPCRRVLRHADACTGKKVAGQALQQVDGRCAIFVGVRRDYADRRRKRFSFD